MNESTRHTEFGMRSSEFGVKAVLVLIPHSEFRIPNYLGAGAVVLLIGLVLLLVPAIAWSCPACKEALFDPGQLAQKLATAKGYALSIGLLLSVPFLLVAGVTMLVVRAAHRKRLVDTPRRWR